METRKEQKKEVLLSAEFPKYFEPRKRLSKDILWGRLRWPGGSTDTYLTRSLYPKEFKEALEILKVRGKKNNKEEL